MRASPPGRSTSHRLTLPSWSGHTRTRRDPVKGMSRNASGYVMIRGSGLRRALSSGTRATSNKGPSPPPPMRRGSSSNRSSASVPATDKSSPPKDADDGREPAGGKGISVSARGMKDVSEGGAILPLVVGNTLGEPAAGGVGV